MTFEEWYLLKFYPNEDKKTKMRHKKVLKKSINYFEYLSFLKEVFEAGQKTVLDNQGKKLHNLQKKVFELENEVEKYKSLYELVVD